MMVVSENNVNVAFPHALRKLLLAGEIEETRNGLVTCLSPFLLEIHRPEQRVLFDPIRQANPFFHVAEFVWMMAGSNDARWISFFNSRMMEYADEDTDTHHGAYGHRWQHHFDVNQIVAVRDLLYHNPNTRRAVLGMWDPATDLEEHNDLPCNTHIYLRIHRGKLDMTVCNRSNDLVWGMLGANIVHMTFLQELIARDLRLHVGTYRVFTNNLHIYHSVPKFAHYLGCRHGGWPHVRDYYSGNGPARTYPILQPEETLEDFLSSCRALVSGDGKVKSDWVENVAYPMLYIYEQRKGKVSSGKGSLHRVKALDWRLAAKEWIEAHELAPNTAEV